MKKILTALFLSALLVSCGGYDDSQIREDIDAQKSRIEQLAHEIAELQQIVDALAAGDYVTGVQPIVQNDVTVGITVSFKNSSAVQIIFAAGGSSSGIVSAVLEDGELVLTLANSEVVKIPATAVPVLALEKDTILVMPGKTSSVAYTVSGGDSGNQVNLFVEGGWSASVVPVDSKSGSVSVVAPNPCGDAKVVAVVASAAGLSSFATLVCLEGVFSVARASYPAAAEAGQVKVAVDNNLGAFDVEIQGAPAWISVQSKTDSEVTFALLANDDEARSATVKLSNAAYQAEAVFKVEQEDGGTFVWKPVSAAASVVAGDCVLAFLRESDSKLLFISGAAAINRNPVAAEAATAEVTFDADDITSVNPAYVWKISASGEYWNLVGSNGLYLIGCDKYQGVAVLTDLKGNYHTTNTYSRNWYFEDDATYGMQMKVTESAGRQVSVAAAATTWTMNPTAERNGKIVIYYKTRL